MAHDLSQAGAGYVSSGAFGQSMSAGQGATTDNILNSTNFPSGFSASCRIKTSSTATIIAVGSSVTNAFFIFATGGNIKVGFGNGSDLLGPNIADGLFHHVVVGWTSAGAYLSLDGTRVATNTVPYPGFPPANCGVRNWPTPEGHDGNGLGWIGEVDDVALFTTQPYAGATYTVPNATLSDAAAGLIAHWKLDGNGNDTAGIVTPAISAPSVAGLMVGGTSTISGSFSNGSPTGLSQVLDGTTTAVGGPTITTTSGSAGSAAGTYSYTVSTPAIGSHTIQVNGTGTFAATGSATSFTTTTAVTIAPNDAAILYSPYNWIPATSTVAVAKNPGAYFRVMFTGVAPTINFDVSVNTAPYVELYWQIDHGPMTRVPVAAAVTTTMPAQVVGNADVPYHLLTVWYTAEDSGDTKLPWAEPSDSTMKFTSLAFGAGSVVKAPGRAPLNIMIAGDSISAGVRTLGELPFNRDPKNNDAVYSWAGSMGHLLGAEVGMCGWGGTGYNNAARGVPNFATTWQYVSAGVTRSFTPQPALIIINHGNNDGGSVAANALLAVNGLLAACPSAHIVLLNPFSRVDNADLAALPGQTTSPGRVHFVSTTGFYNTTYGADTTPVHPSGPNGVALIAPSVAAAVRKYLPQNPRWTH